MCGRVSAPAKRESRHRKELLLVSTAQSSDTLNHFQMNNKTGLACLTESDKITDVSVTVMAAYSLNVCVCVSVTSGIPARAAERCRFIPARNESAESNSRQRGFRAHSKKWAAGRWGGWCNVQGKGVREQAWKMKCTNGVDVESTERVCIRSRRAVLHLWKHKAFNHKCT